MALRTIEAALAAVVLMACGSGSPEPCRTPAPFTCATPLLSVCSLTDAGLIACEQRSDEECGLEAGTSVQVWSSIQAADAIRGVGPVKGP